MIIGFGPAVDLSVSCMCIDVFNACKVPRFSPFMFHGIFYCNVWRFGYVNAFVLSEVVITVMID